MAREQSRPNLTYDELTRNSRNPIARFAHRSRIARSIRIAKSLCPNGRILDFGCGDGHFVWEINSGSPSRAIGYEPYMRERAGDGIPIFSEMQSVVQRGPFDLITLFETIEHLSDAELTYFLESCSGLLRPEGQILVSAPIEIGPTILLKEINRAWFRRQKVEYSAIELFRTAVLCKAPPRDTDIKLSHKGFDFREALQACESFGYRTSILEFGPLPLGTWYGNSQVFFSLRK